jgi:hypothetical protein
VEDIHRLLDWRQAVPAVDLVEVDIVEPEPPQRGVDRGKDVLAGQATTVRAHWRVLCLPKLIIPRHTRDTRGSVFPRFTYRIAASFRDRPEIAGHGSAGVLATADAR